MVYRFTGLNQSHLFNKCTYVLMKDSLEHGITGLQVYISASKIETNSGWSVQIIPVISGLQVYRFTSLLVF